MFKVQRISPLLGVSVVVMLYAGMGKAQVPSSPNLLPTTTQSPEAFGTNDYTIAMISALSFNGESFIPAAPLSRASQVNVVQHFYATLDIPAGVIIDYIGLNNSNDGTPLVTGVQIWQRYTNGGYDLVAGISNSAHIPYQTDINSAPIGFLYQTHLGNQLILDVGIAASPNPQYFGWVEVWWRRTVSPPQGSPTFNDVPTSHPFFQYIQALAASGVTSGCQASPPLYCPDRQITRGEMAVFLAKALGLHWPD
jgi:hypothetical protein